MKRTLLTLICSLCTLAASADEGMWLPSLIAPRIADMRDKGFRLTADDIYSINQASLKDAVVLFGGGCTGELVSAEGLLLTNHHCGYNAIQAHSSVEHDYLTDGFWAQSRDEELPNEGLHVSFLVRMEEVTDRIAAGETPEAIVAAAEAEGKGFRAAVEQMYYGNQQFLFVYRRFDDVRLVAAPPSAIGKFGGDTDNWIWPRHTGDFSVFRIYADRDNEPAAYSPDNVPYRPRRHFPVSTRGVAEGDFTMIYGFPGNTQRYIISDAAAYVAERSNPMKIDLRTRRLDIIGAAQEADPAVRIMYAAKHATIANAWKKWQGESLGLKRLGTVAEKRGYEARFAAWAADKPAYAGILDSLHAAYAAESDAYFLLECYAESIGAIELLRPAARALDYYADSANRDKPLVTDRFKVFFKDYDSGIDRAVAKQMIAGFLDYVPAGKVPEPLAEALARHGGVEGYVDALFDASCFVSPARLNEALARSDAEAVLKADPAAELYGWFDTPEYRARRPRNLSNIPAIERWYKPYMQALRAFDPDRAFYPDANLTLRVAYGAVAGYEYADGEYHKPQTTLDGIIAKDDPAIYDYNVPQTLRDCHAAKDYGRWATVVDGRTTVPVCFLATNHTTGGNSGSPIINGDGELVGINFDRTWRSTMSDIEFDPTICRNISVDIRYVLFVIDRIGHAAYLFDEMTLR